MIVIMYHDNCCDGFTAAWLAKRFIKDELVFIPVNYNEDHSRHVEAIRGKRVLVFDFAFPREVMLTFHSICQSFEVYDHHKTSQQDCEGLDFCHFDMSKSGAMLAWNYLQTSGLVPAGPPLDIVDYVQDYDLWQFKLRESKAINAVIHSAEKTFDRWSILAGQLETVDGTVELARMGNVLLGIEKAAIENAITFACTMIIGGHRVPVINNPNLISKTVGALAKDQPFAAAFFMRKDGKFVFSLRSTKDGLDVSEIAKQFPGGGGHKNAAGFTVGMNEFTSIWDTLQ